MENQTVVRENEHRFEGFFAKRGSRWVIGAAALMVLLAGLWTAYQSGEACDRQMRDKLVRRAVDVAATFGVRASKELSFTPDDKEKGIFQRKCAQLQAYAEVFESGPVYGIGLRDGQIVSGPESSLRSALQPGTVYENPDQQYFDVFEKGQPQVWVSLNDRGRKHLTALAPILDPYTGDVLTAIGVDAKAAEWPTAVLRARAVPVWVTIALLVVLLLSDLILEYLRRNSAQRTGRKRHAEPVLCAVFMILLTLTLAVHFDQMDRLERSHTFRLLAHMEAVALETRIFDLRGTLRELAYYFQSSEYIDREKFHSLCEVMGLKNLFYSIMWIPAVPEKEVQSFIEEVRASGVPDFFIYQRGEYRRGEERLKEPVSSRPVYYPALYVEPPFRDRATGFDVNSEPKRSVALQEALSSGMVAASDPIKFVSESNSPNGIIVFQSMQARVQKGLLAVKISPETLIAALVRKNGDMNIRLFQLDPRQEPIFVAGSSDSGGSRLEDREPSLGITFPIFRFGKAYVFRVTPSSGWLAKHPLKDGRVVLGVGLLLTLLITSLAAFITNRRIVLERLVERRTDELKLAHENMKYLNQQNELILTSAAEGILGLDSKGNHRFVNPSALKMLGYAAEELIGKPSHSLWHHSKPDRTPYPEEECKIYATCRDGDVHYSADEVFWRKDGTCFPVEYDSTPIYENGQVAGAVITFTDITERKKVEGELNRSLSLLDATLNATADGILVVDGKGGRILRYNKKFIEMWRIPEEIAATGSDEGMISFVLEQLCEPEKFLAKVREMYRNPGEKSFDILHFHDGRVFERFSQPQRISDGVIGRVWSFHDITEREQSEALLWASQTKLDLALQSAQMGVWQWDVVANKRTYDRQTCAFLGVNPVTFGSTEADFLAVVHPDDRQKVKDALTQTAEQHAPYDMEHRVIWPDRSVHHIAVRAQLFLDDGDQQLKISGVCWDITDRKRAEDELRDAKGILQAAMDHSPAGIAVADAPSGKLRYVNKAALRIRGGTHDEVVSGIGLDEYVASWKLFNIDGTPLPLDEVPLARAIKYGEINQREFIIRRPDGEDRIVFANAAPITDSQGKTNAAIVVFLDITGRRKAEERIRLLAEHLQEVREEERKRIARELHDDIGQILTAIKIDLVGVQADCQCGGDAKNKMADIQKLLLDGIQSVHALCRQLRPGALDDLDLSNALEGLMEDWKVRNLVECTICSDVDDEALSDEVKTAVFRMVQEALTNVSRYAQASKVEIHLVADEQAINVTITDNGRGMEPGAEDKPTSFGLLGMRERIENLGGELGIESEPGKGTRIEGTIPLSKKG
ncbi:MAG: PAS domain S-box protein [Kiritimatiellales bacterium]